GPSFQPRSQQPIQIAPRIDSEISAARHPHSTVMKVRTGARAILATEAEPARKAPGRPRLAGGCHEYAAVCMSAELGPSARPSSMRVTTSIAKLALTTSGSMTSDQVRPRASRAQRRVMYLFNGPAKKPPTVNVTKNSDPTRPIWEELMP